MTTLETLIAEKAELEKKNREIEEQINELKKAIYWNKRRIVLCEKQMKEAQPKDAEQ